MFSLPTVPLTAVLVVLFMLVLGPPRPDLTLVRSLRAVVVCLLEAAGSGLTGPVRLVGARLGLPVTPLTPGRLGAVRPEVKANSEMLL